MVLLFHSFLPCKHRYHVLRWNVRNGCSKYSNLCTEYWWAPASQLVSLVRSSSLSLDDDHCGFKGLKCRIWTWSTKFKKRITNHFGFAIIIYCTVEFKSEKKFKSLTFITYLINHRNMLKVSKKLFNKYPI